HLAASHALAFVPLRQAGAGLKYFCLPGTYLGNFACAPGHILPCPPAWGQYSATWLPTRPRQPINLQSANLRKRGLHDVAEFVVQPHRHSKIWAMERNA